MDIKDYSGFNGNIYLYINDFFFPLKGWQILLSKFVQQWDILLQNYLYIYTKTKITEPTVLWLANHQ